MATASQVLDQQYVEKCGGGFAGAPHIFIEMACRTLTQLPLKVMLMILDSTAKPCGNGFVSFRWSGKSTKDIAKFCAGTVSDTAKALRYLEKPVSEGGRQLLRSRKRGKCKEYQIIAGNIGLPAEPLKPRTCRKPPQSDTTHQRSKSESVETVEVTESISAMDREIQRPIEKIRVESGEAPPPDVRSNSTKELTDFCIETITPKLGTCPEQKFIAQAVKVLAGCPLERLKCRILQRINKITSWAMLPLLAEDVRKAHVELKRVTQARGPAQYDLTADWSSATKIRRLYSSGETPEPVKSEIVLMWPELQNGRKKSRIEEQMARL